MTMVYRLVVAFSLSLVLIAPSVAHTPEICKQQENDVLYAYLGVSRASGSLEPSFVSLLSKKALVHVINEFLGSLNEAFQADIALRDCIDGK